MPRNGSGSYERPFPDVAEGTTIESGVYNGFTSDITVDLNTARPILYGGTGASNARDAMIALSGEIAKQVVDNYNSYPFVNGSFYSPAIAGIGAPVDGRAFLGLYYESGDHATVPTAVMEARDATTGLKYARGRPANGTWTPWKPDSRDVGGSGGGAYEGIAAPTANMFFGVVGTAPNAAFVVNNKADLTGTNILNVYSASAIVTINGVTNGGTSLNLNKGGGGAVSNSISGLTNGAQRWLLRLGNDGTETGGAPGAGGSDFDLHRYKNDGSYAGFGMSISRETGAANFGGSISTGSTIAAGGALTGGSISSGGALNVATTATVNGEIVVGGASGSYGVIRFCSPAGSGGNYIHYDGAGFNISRPLNVNANLSCNQELKVRGNGNLMRFRDNNGPYSMVTHLNGDGFYFIPTNAWDMDGGLSGLRPFTISCGSGHVTMSHGLTVYGNINGTTTGSHTGDSSGTHTGPSTGNHSGTIGIGGTGTANVWHANAFDIAGVRFADWDGGTFFIHNPQGNIALHLHQWENVHESTYHTFRNAGNNTSYAQIRGDGFEVWSGGIYCHNGGMQTRGYKGRQGYNGGYTANNLNGEYTNSNYFWTDDTLTGYSFALCDYRTKRDIEPLAGVWDRVKRLRPIKYKHRDYTPPVERERREREKLGPFFKGSDDEQWGFVAHELQATLIKSAAHGEKDAPNQLQGPEPLAIIAALTAALQEAMARIEALEARAA